MGTSKNDFRAEVISVFPNKVKISIDNFDSFSEVDGQIQKLRIGSYLEISDNENHKMIAIIENYFIECQNNETQVEEDEGEEVNDLKNRKYIIEANPLGTIVNGEFKRGGDSLTIPPTDTKPASEDDIRKIYSESIKDEQKFCFSSLSHNSNIQVPVNGNKFFNKHFAIVGSTGSGKSCTVAKILQSAINSKNGEYDELNNSHIVVFDIHNEYYSAFPKANSIGVKDLVLPYWLLNSEELEELFLDTEANDHNQRNVFKEAIVEDKKLNFKGEEEIKEKIHYDSPLFFDIQSVLNLAKEKDMEMVQGAKVGQKKQGPLYGKLTNFVSRLENKINDKRLEFLLGGQSKSITFEDTIRQFLAYKNTAEENSNITIIDLSGVPFEVLSITVSLISRILFEYGYFYKKCLEGMKCETPLLLVYEEAHKYVPKSDLIRYRASKKAIERIAKEGRKYGVTLGIVSQRPSEISETIFSQCNNFVAMRLTNPDDQNYVKKLLPDTLGNLTESLPSLQSGEALLIGDSIIIPSLVKIELANPEPKSADIQFYEIWKEKWKDVDFSKVINEWEK
ncbi:MAG: ATP-binding protein [Calditrichaeota bacterium]|nr:MAG: ATP-binding protein [Calditrichota bacterium]